MTEAKPDITFVHDDVLNEDRVTVAPALALGVTSKVLSQIMGIPNLGVWGADDNGSVTRFYSRNNQAGEEGIRGVGVIIEHLLG